MLFLYSFCLVALTIAAKSARDAYFLSRYDRSLLPIMFGAGAAAVAVAVAAYTRLAKHLGGRAAFNWTNGLFATSLILLQPRISGFLIPVSYVWLEVITVVTMLQFWLLVPTIFDPRRAKRLYGPIAGGGSLGAIVMGLTLKPFVHTVGSGYLLYLVVALILASGKLALMASKFAADQPKVSVPAYQKPAKQTFNQYVIGIAVAISMAAVVTTVVDYQFKILAGRTFHDEAGLVSFFGSFYAATGAASLLAQFVLTSFVLSRFGILAGLLVLPILHNIGVAAILLNPALASAVIAKFSDQTFKFTLTNTAMELLWLPVGASRRLALKPIVSGTFKSASEGAAGILMYLLVPLVAIQQLSWVSLTALVVWIITVLRLRSLYVKEVAQAVENGRISFSELHVDVRDRVMVSTIERTLLSGSEPQILFALQLIEGLPLEPWSKPLAHLLAQDSLAVRKRILAIAGDSPGVLPESALMDAIGRADDASADALLAAGRRDLSIGPLLQEMLASPNAELRAAAATALKSAMPEASHKADTVLASMLWSNEPDFVAAAIHRLAHDAATLPTSRLTELINAPSRIVRSAALEALGTRADARAVLPIIRSVDGRSDLSSARRLLRQFPANLVGELLTLEFAGASGDVKRASTLARILADYPCNESCRSLLNAINPRDLDAGEVAAEALLRSARAVPPSGQTLSALAAKIGELSERAYFFTRVLQLLPKSETALLSDYYDHQFKRALTVILRLSAMRNPSTPIETCIQIIQVREPRRLPFVLELLDGLLSQKERRLIYPLIETASNDERDRAGAVHFPSLPNSLEPLLVDNVSKGQPWLAAISLDYVSRWKPSLVSFIVPSRLSANGLMRETAQRLEAAEAANIPSGSPISLEVSPKMYTTLEKAVFLKSVSLFQTIPAERIADIAQVAVETRIPANQVLFREGDHGDSLYIVLDGCVLVHKAGRTLASLTQGGCVGEMAVLDQVPRSADATTVEDSTLLRIDQEAFYEVLTQSPELMNGIIRLLTTRLRIAGERLVTAPAADDSASRS